MKLTLAAGLMSMSILVDFGVSGTGPTVLQLTVHPAPAALFGQARRPTSAPGPHQIFWIERTPLPPSYHHRQRLAPLLRIRAFACNHHHHHYHVDLGFFYLFRSVFFLFLRRFEQKPPVPATVLNSRVHPPHLPPGLAWPPLLNVW